MRLLATNKGMEWPRGWGHFIFKAVRRIGSAQAKAAASKMPIRASSLFHGFRGGGTYRLEAGMRCAMASAILCFVVAPSASKYLRTCAREYVRTGMPRRLASCNPIFRFWMRGARRVPRLDVSCRTTTSGVCNASSESICLRQRFARSRPRTSGEPQSTGENPYSSSTKPNPDV